MIKNIFLPEKIGDYYLFSKRLVGVDIGKTHVSAALLYMRGKVITIERCIEEKIESGPAATYDERVVGALKIIFEQLVSYDAVYVTLSSSLVVFKELKLPFISHEKIEMVVNFEVEPLLPFSLQDAVIDFIITKQIPEEKSSEILVAAVQKKHIVHCLEIFGQAKILVDKIVVDLFALYSLYKRIPAYSQLAGSIVLIDFGLQSTRIVYLFDGQLRSIRTLNKGVSHMVKAVSDVLNISRNEAMEHIIRFGLEKTDWPEYTQAVTDALTTFWHTINFTLSSFISQTPENSINKIILIGGGGQIKGLSSFVSTLLQIPVEIFDPALIMQDKEIHSPKKHIVSNACIIALSVALPSPIIKYFNFRRDEFQIVDHTLLIKQLVVTLLLTGTLLSMLLGYYFIQVKKLTREVHSSEQQAINVLKKQFKIPKEEDDLEEVISLSQEEVTREQETWFAFSGKARASFLQYLLELASNIDRKSLGFTIDNITIAEGTILLKAKVRDHEALKLLERELRQSKLFSYVEPQDNPSFTMKIILVPTIEE